MVRHLMLSSGPLPAAALSADIHTGGIFPTAPQPPHMRVRALQLCTPGEATAVPVPMRLRKPQPALAGPASAAFLKHSAVD